MARPLRVEYPNACYHVTNRGNRRDKVFFSDSDYLLFLYKLAKYADLYDVVIYAYCLMPNHYHLFLRTRNANLGKFMQSFNTSFTLSMNNKHNKSGHLFQGRYKAQVVETEFYKNKLSRYIHLNPVKIKSLKNKPLAELKKHLRNYKWSSFMIYLGIKRNPSYLNRSLVLSSWGKNSDEKIKNYRKYVEEGLLSDNGEELSPNEITNIIGTDSFNDKIIRKYLRKSHEYFDGREQPELLKINTLSIDKVINCVAKYFNINNQTKITLRKGANRSARVIAMYMAVKYCKKTNTLATIASSFGVGINGISSNTTKCKEKLLKENIFFKQIKNIEELLYKNTKAKVCPLHTKDLGENIYIDHVHFNEETRTKQAKFIADNLIEEKIQ